MTNEKLIEEFSIKLNRSWQLSEPLVVRDTLSKALTRSRLDTLEEVLRGMPERVDVNYAQPSVDLEAAFKQTWNSGHNACRDAVIKMIEDLKTK